MELTTYFKDFLAKVRPTASQLDDCKNGHRVLRERLLSDDFLKDCIVTTFLQGSYRRATAVRPHEGKRSDVDVVVVTRLHQDEYPVPEKVVELFRPFLDEHYPGKYEVHDRAIAITLSYVDLDLVVTSAPSESMIGILESDSVTGDETPDDAEAQDWRFNESWLSPPHRSTRWDVALRMAKAQEQPQWQTEPLYIPSRDKACWVPTDPLAQIRWTWDKNRACNAHYVNVVKALKWWRRLNAEPKYPKGYPMEHLIGSCCPDNISSVAEGVVKTLETIRDRYWSYALSKTVPVLPDHGVPDHNVFHRVNGEDFAAFYTLVTKAASTARTAYNSDSPRESALEWGKLFGDKFPEPPPDDDNGGDGPEGGFTPRTRVSNLTGGRFA